MQIKSNSQFSPLKLIFVFFLCSALSTSLTAMGDGIKHNEKMAGYYMVKVLEINESEASVKMHVRMFNPDGNKIYESVGFALSLLSNRNWKTSLIGSEVDRADLHNPDWSRKYANGFVKSISKEDLESNGLPIAILTIYLTDKAWIDHLNVGDEWESYAYEVSQHYDQCEPIFYHHEKKKHSGDIDTAEYWMPIPSFLFDQRSLLLPNVVYIPKYTESSYLVDSIIQISSEDIADVKKYHGQYVKDIEEDEYGILIYRGGEIYATLNYIGDKRRGAKYYYQSSPISKIGLLTPKPNFKRHNIRTNYSNLIKSANPVIVSASHEGSKITLKVAGIFDVEELQLTKGRVLKMIIYNFLDSHGTMNKEFPLSKLLQYLADEKTKTDTRWEDYIFEADDVVSDVADGIILNYSVEAPSYPLEDFDIMDRQTLVDYFEDEKWPCHTFHISVSDEAFALQIPEINKSSIPMNLISVGGDNIKWENPILWDHYKDLMSNH